MSPTALVRKSRRPVPPSRPRDWVGRLMALPVAERAVLAAALLESLETETAPDLSTEWKSEVDRRLREVRTGAVSLRDADSVFRDAFASLA